jgi:4-hydroxy-tetrahydrodipicolinate synthase
MREYTELALSGKFDEAEKIARPMQPLREVAAKWLRANWVQRKLVPISFIKAWCEMVGMAGGPVRPGLPQISGKERQELQADLERTAQLIKIIGIKAE